MYIRLFISLIASFISVCAQSQTIATPRIYYHKEELLGKSVETKAINLGTFNSILQNAEQRSYRIGEKSRLILKDGDFDSVMVEMFKYCTVRKDDIMYDSDKGSFYLPEAVILFDVNDYSPFPSEFYFIAKVGNQLDLCRCNGGEDIEWYRLPEHCSPVDDPVIMEKMEETMDYLEGFMAYKAEQKIKEESEKKEDAADDKLLCEEQKAAYIALTELCMPYSSKKQEVLSFIEGLKQYANDLEYKKTAYNEFCIYLNHNQIPFILSLDWKEAVGELEAWINSAMEENFNKTFRFNYGGIYDENSTVSDIGLFVAFDNMLRKSNFQISMLETDGDEYRLIIHPVDVIDKVINAVSIMGLSLNSIE